jgi:hypothetical protein
MSFHSFIIWYMLWSELVKCHKEQWLELAGFPTNFSRGKETISLTNAHKNISCIRL